MYGILATEIPTLYYFKLATFDGTIQIVNCTVMLLIYSFLYLFFSS